MKYKENDKSKVLCFKCEKLTETTFYYKDVPLSESKKIIKSILVGVCDCCNSVVSIPSQSIPEIKKQMDIYKRDNHGG